MFPNSRSITVSAQNAKQTGTKSYLFDFEKGDFAVRDGKLVECDGIDAIKVWIEKILRTEKNRYKIYDGTDYGCQIEDLIIGNTYSFEFTDSELKREIEEALLQNPKIIAISKFLITRNKNSVTVELEVNTNDTGGNTVTVTF